MMETEMEEEDDGAIKAGGTIARSSQGNALATRRCVLRVVAAADSLSSVSNLS